MNTMNMPRFTAETSLYKTHNHYRSAGGSLPSNGNTTVIPQACRWWAEGPVCAGVIAGGSVVCTASCLAAAEAGPLGGYPCYLCWAGALGATYGFCRDCIPGWIRAIIDAFDSSSGGVELPCCPPGTVCKCGGHCYLGQCTGPCLPPGAACPATPPPPPPNVCEAGEKCCEHDEQRNCTKCIPHNWSC
jgi:hypothetical protein